MTRLYRSTRDRVVTGLAGGVAETIGIDSTLFRILLLISIPFTGGTVIPVYIIAALIIPKEQHYNPFGPGPGAPGGSYGGYQHGPHGHGSNGGYGGHGGHAGNGGNGGYGHDPYGSQSNHNPNFGKSQAYSAPDSGLDAMMKDIEKKALQKEVEELKQKLSKYEKGEV
ncbi:PspC domain-containing protein [Paenibacillus sp. GCM10012306]|uniref:PspC domain-containing protein n=1 Tax=Paenibacillus sp. GCM10012306 TaxID=3317342 RepID=UPI003605F47A